MIHKKISISRYITERANEILEIIKNTDYHKVLLYAPTGSGKTTLLTSIYEHAKENNCTMIVVSPNVANIKQESKDKGIEGLCERKCYEGSDRVITTPDKLPHVTGYLNAQNKAYMLVVDEAHERYCNTLRYEAFNNITLAEPKAEKVIYMSATPEPMPRDIFDIEIEVERLNNTPVDFELRVIEQVSAETFLDNVLKAKTQHKQVVAFINDKKIIKAMTETLKQTHPKLKVGYMNSHTKENEIYKTIVEESKLLSYYDIIFTTEVIKAGVNINEYEQDLALVIRGRDLIQVDLIQFVARFRNGASEVISLFSNPGEVPATKSRQTIYNELLESATDLVSAIKKLPHKSESLLKSLENDYGIIKDLDTGEYIIDYVLLRCASERQYNAELRANINLYAKTLRETKAIKFNVTTSDTHQISQNDALRDNLKQTKEQELEDYKNALEYIKSKSEVLQEITFNGQLDLRVDYHQDMYDVLQVFKESSEYKLISKVSKSIYKGDMYKAYKELCDIGKDELELKYKQYVASEINRIYGAGKKEWANYIKAHRKDTFITELSKVRMLCDDVGLKNGFRVTNKKLIDMLRVGIEKKYIKGVTIDELEDEQKNKKVKRAVDKLLKNLQMICTFCKGNQVSSYR